ncbi:S-layer homology domain-containing protein [Paenibacillus sinopodophylli]|uniref:S-layer homology domain-containing protein n=1 Tax=Paenibacillus sinopodophylli TaxID=1837342 RepID=UPI00110D0A4B|nr:S-layer homology domain-containing protein [Paenibacillus sinopodophylli]
MYKNKKWLAIVLCCTMLTSFLTLMAPAYADNGESGGAGSEEFTEQELKDNDYILYFVNAGDPTPATVEGADKLGLYSSVTEQVYGIDPVTSKAWGLVTTTTGTSVSNGSTKSGSARYYNGTQVRDKALAYNFELPAGEYDITFGFVNPWSGRSVNLLVEGNNVSGGDLAIGAEGAEKVVTYRKLSVTDGLLNVRIQGPATAALSNYNDPLISYLIIRQNITVPLSELDNQIAAAEAELANTAYTTYSLAELSRVIQESKTLKQTLAGSNADVTEPAVQEQIITAIAALKNAVAELVINAPNASFKPGAVWRDTNGALIQAHGAGMMYDDQTETYYWYGEDKTFGYLPARGVRVYSSKDLYNWEDHGLALTAIGSADDFVNDPLISALYADRTDKADILNDIGTDRIIERPKVIYNDLTKKYVMWMHTDGPSTTSTANYAKAEAGYALSDSPLGPFVYQRSDRMDQAPAGATDNGQPSQPGMARDMTLFKDDDGTGYLVYSSEENLTIYISKLNPEYTDVVGWHKDGNVERDTQYKGVHGVDYVRVFPLAQREAPALFKYQGKYYMITSGATGWAPNVGKYTVADNIMGPWKTMRDVAPGSSTTYGSQSTQVITVDAAAGKFIYMGDRWNQNDLANSRYIWLPIEFGKEDEIKLRWEDEWTLDLLDGMGKVTVNTTLPSSAFIGRAPLLPTTVNITLSDGTSKDTPITWNVGDTAFQNPGVVQVSGTLTELANKKIEHQLYVVPESESYFVNAGGAETSDYLDMIALIGEEKVLNGETIDQKYDPDNGQTWGYVGDNTMTAGTSSGTIFTSLRYLTSNAGNDLSYRFDLADDEYDVYVGLYDPWAQYSNGKRIADIIVNGEVKTSGYVFTAATDVLGYSKVAVTDGKLDLTVHRSANAGTSSSDPQISWIIVAKNLGIRVTDVSLDKTEITLKQEEQAQLTAAIAPLDAANQELSWSSSNDAVATVSDTGVVTAVSHGVAIITTTTSDGGFTATSIVTVEQEEETGGETTPTPTPTPSTETTPTPTPSTETTPTPTPVVTTPVVTSAPVTPSPSPTAAPSEVPSTNFVDTEGHWAAPAIHKLADQNILGGFPDGSFQPDKQISRAEYMAVMYRLLKLDTAAGESSFGDISSSAWYSKYVKGLSEAGIVTGFQDGSFKPNQELTREEAFVILYRALGDQLTPSTETSQSAFSDRSSVASWAQEAIDALTKAGLIKGYEDGSLRPKEKITRAEIASIVANFVK